MAWFVDRGQLEPGPDREIGYGTGAVRTSRPVYVTRDAPCARACPLNHPVQRWLSLLQAEAYHRAWDIVMESTPFPAIHGRVCGHPCQPRCNRGELDEPVQIQAAERFLGDLAIEEGWQPPAAEEATGKRVLVVGAGPAGLSAAYHLLRHGHAVTVMDAGPAPGGLMRYGIPPYELPHAVLDAEILRIERLGASLELGHRVEDVLGEREAGGFDAVFLGLGADDRVPLDRPPGSGGGALDAVTLLRDLAQGQAPALGSRVAVWGGGRTALVVARVLLRRGVKDVVWIDDQERVPDPVVGRRRADAIAEGVQVTPGGEVQAIETGGWSLRDPSDDRADEPMIDTLVVAQECRPAASGLRSIPGIRSRANGTLVTDDRLMSGLPGIFLGGDLVSDAQSVATAVRHGRDAAFHMDHYLRETSWAPAAGRELATFDRLNLWYRDAVPPAIPTPITPARRAASFDEVTAGLTGGEAVSEAGRCLSCGTCCACDGCRASCPEGAVTRLGLDRRYRVDYERCTGCAICHDQCPCGAMAMVAEPHRKAARSPTTYRNPP